MDTRQIRDHLLPSPERDPKFRDHLRRLSYGGLQTVAAAEIAVPVLMQVGRMTVSPESISGARLWQTAAMILVGAITLALSTLGWSKRRARLLAALSGWTASTLLTWTAIWKPAEYLGTDDYIVTGITIVVLTVVATVPFRPWHALALGLAIEGMYILSVGFAGQWEISIVPVHSASHHIFLVLLAMLATGISTTNYRHRRAEYESNQEAVRVAEALTGAQLRAELAENAISVGKMAAALSHELNSPLGALRSSIDTLMEVTDRQIVAAADQKQRLTDARLALRRSIDESTARIQEVTSRLRRFVNLEEADLKSADLNELVSDVTLLYQEELQQGGIRLEFDLQKGLSPLTCRPQLLTAVFSTLLSNAIHAVNGDGRILIRTREQDSQVEVAVRDNGRGMSREQADTIFDPTFKVAGSRVSSGNWSLFNSRQIVYEHGGEIRLETAEGKGTTVYVTLPAGARGSSEPPRHGDNAA